MNVQCEWSGKIFSTIAAFVLHAVGEHVPVQALTIFQTFAAASAEEGSDVRVRLDVSLQFGGLLERLAALVADVFAQARLSLGLVHSHLVLKRKCRTTWVNYSE